VKGHWETFRAQFRSTSEVSQEISRQCSGWMQKEFGVREERNISKASKEDSRYRDDSALMDEIGRKSSHSR
jgi:hypothetical protein